MSDKKILVLGATGQQGGAAVRHLIADGWKVRAFVRDLSSDKALKLSQLGAELFLGDMGDLASLDAAMHRVYGVFSVQASGWDPTLESNAEERRIGKAVADAALKANIQHFVYTSVGGADAQSRYRDMQKWDIEQYIHSLDLPATILRPATFMENFADPMSAGVQNGTIAQAFKPDGVIPLVAVDDIGAFVALALRYPADYLGKTIEIAGDKLTPLQIADVIGRITNRTIPYVQIPLETLRQHNDILAGVFQWLNEEGHEVDISVVRKVYPELTDFNTWVEKQGKAKFEALFLTERT
ncbi:NmrA/HSCARG family protein [Paenibacillus radicis (ex Gao et al. 2016)]|uniref:NmrA family transcriptional regulator n=1 Tax=Paenibacillus radicis (ex Gao et al. 2016) TaxID=1737354 RepID=A0A917HGX8_9BACL|nr:NmrA/HSCARG family protein [Paenibacillus radicis (ex Gao et al. 2016)]GGG78488.1 NmrA family transcriptional regulator [Paenibacillus radicis (ex Gao et al. 2016)]